MPYARGEVSVPEANYQLPAIWIKAVWHVQRKASLAKHESVQ